MIAYLLRSIAFGVALLDCQSINTRLGTFQVFKDVNFTVRSGEIVEFGDCDQMTARPEHSHTQRLSLAAPVADPLRQAERRLQFLNSARVA